MSAARRLRHPLVILASALLGLPFAVRAIGMTDGVATEIVIFALVGLGFNTLLGYTGLVSFGHAAFFGLAAYAAALLQIHWLRGHVLLPMGLGTLFAAALGVVIGFLALRRRGVYFSLLTLAFTAMIFSIVYRWTSFTGGENGLRGMTRVSLLGLNVEPQLHFYYATSAIALAVAWLLWRVVHSPLGRVLVAIRENEQRARFLGYPVQRYKLIAFTLSAAVTGLGGCLYAFLKVFVSADLVHVAFSGEILAMSIIGGMGHFLGPPLGGAFFIVFREALSEVTAAWQFWFGLLFMAFILFSPAGLIGLGARLLAPFRRGREEAAAMAARVIPEPGQEVAAFLRRPGGADDGVLLECRRVGKRFGEFTAVRDVDLALPDRRLHALIGPNGAGKTTLFNICSGMYPPDGGELRLGGERLDGLPPERIVGRGLARSFQITNLFPALTVFENLRLAAQARNPRRFNAWRSTHALATVNRETRELVQFLGLEGVEEAPVASLSYGGQRLVEMGVALAARPRVLLLDEPLAGLAAGERERVTGLVRRLTEHMAVLLVEHDIDRVFAFADRITVMNEGRVIADGPVEVVRHDPLVQEVYLGHGRDMLVASAARAPGVTSGSVMSVAGIDTFYGKSHILHEVSLEVRAGEVVGLLGRNGAGKSSTLKSVMGLVAPARGRVEFTGRDITGHSPEEISRLGMGFVPQGRRLFPNLTVSENLALGRLRRRGGDGVRWEQERIFEFFPRVRERLDAKAETLSGGEQQMVAIARALSGRIKLLLLDEPFEGLAPAVTATIFAALDRLRREVPILIVEHDLDLVLALADRVYVLDRGRISYEGAAAPLQADRDLRRRVLWV